MRPSNRPPDAEECTAAIQPGAHDAPGSRRHAYSPCALRLDGSLMPGVVRLWVRVGESWVCEIEHPDPAAPREPGQPVMVVRRRYWHHPAAILPLVPGGSDRGAAGGRRVRP